MNTKLILILSFNCLNLFAGIGLSDSSEFYFIGKELESFCDSTNRLRIEEISAPGFDDNFTPLSQALIYKNPAQANWLRLTLRNNSNRTAWYFESWGFDMDNFEFYLPVENGFKKMQMGYGHPFNKRDIFHKNPVVELNLKPGETKIFYLKVQRHAPIHLTYIVRSFKNFTKHLTYEYWYLGIFYGVFLFIGVATILLYSSLRDSIYLFYLACVASELLYCFRRDGLGFQFLWPDFPAFNHILEFNIPQTLFIISTLFYSIKFLELKRRLPLFYRITLGAIAVRILLFAGMQFTVYRNENIFLADCLFLIIPFAAGIISMKKKLPYAKFYVCAFSSLFISFILILLESYKLLPPISINWYWINIGLLFEVLFLAMSLMSNIRYLRKQREDAHQRLIRNLKKNNLQKEQLNLELEQKVEARTFEIQSMISELKEKNIALESAKKNMELLNQQVSLLNEALNQDNQRLRSDVTELGQSKILLKDVSLNEFKTFFPDDNSCLKYLAELKWEKGYKCRKCGYNKAMQEEERLGMRCRNCKYLESPTSGTLFHKLKFPITKAFYLMYLIYLKGKSMSLEELSTLLELRRETCWSFRKKILEAQEEYQKQGIQQSEHGWAAIVLYEKGEV